MAFYSATPARTYLQSPVKVNHVATGNSSPLSGSTSTTTGQTQQSSPLSSANNLMTSYKAGKGIGNLADDASRLYGRYTMESGVTPESVLAGSGTESQNAAFLSGGGSSTVNGSTLLDASSSAQPIWDAGLSSGASFSDTLATAQTLDGATLLGGGAETAAGVGEATGETLLSSTSTATPWLDAATTAAGTEAVAADAAATTAATATAEAAGTTAAAETAGTAALDLGTEAAGLGTLGPIGILAGAGIMGTKLAGLW